jgi:hypothetical protein
MNLLRGMLHAAASLMFFAPVKYMIVCASVSKPHKRRRFRD